MNDMQLVREDLARIAVESFRTATEWPHHAIFLVVKTYDGYAIASGVVTHGDLFRMLKQQADLRGVALRPLSRDDDVYDGHIEWESDGSYFARTHAGESLPDDLNQILRNLIDRLMNETP